MLVRADSAGWTQGFLQHIRGQREHSMDTCFSVGGATTIRSARRSPRCQRQSGSGAGRRRRGPRGCLDCRDHLTGRRVRPATGAAPPGDLTPGRCPCQRLDLTGKHPSNTTRPDTAALTPLFQTKINKRRGAHDHRLTERLRPTPAVRAGPWRVAPPRSDPCPCSRSHIDTVGRIRCERRTLAGKNGEF